MPFNTHTIEICTDCLLFIANGDEPEDTGCCDDHHWSDDHERVSVDGWAVSCMESQWPSEEGWQLHAGASSEDCEACGDPEYGCEGWFSSSPCEGCGSSLGGDRHHATAMQPDELTS